MTQFYPDTLCLVGEYLVLRGPQWNSKNCVFKIYNLDTGELNQEWETQCQHYWPCGTLTSYERNDSVRKQPAFVEGCSAESCEVIRGHCIFTQEASTVCKTVKPQKICNGPGGTLLVCDLKSNSLTQLTPENIEQMKFQITHQSPLECQLISGMTFIEHYDMLVLTSKESKQIQGIKWPSGDTVWQYDGMIGDIPLNPHDISNTKDGRVFVANGNNLLTLDAGDGALSNIQFETQTQPIKKVACCNNKICHQRRDIF